MKSFGIVWFLVFSLVRFTKSEKSENFAMESKDNSSFKIGDKGMQRPPQYVTYLQNLFDESFVDRGKETDRTYSKTKVFKVKNRVYAIPTESLFSVWLPTEVNQETAIGRVRNVATFQQSKRMHDFGNFSHCQVILTLRDDVTEEDLPHPSTTFVNIFTQENERLQQGTNIQDVIKNQKFYAFDITDFIISHQTQYNMTFPNLINLTFEVVSSPGSRNGKILDFSKLFHGQGDMPLIVFFYNGFTPDEIDHQQKHIIRKRRTPDLTKYPIYPRPITINPGRPITQCQRREFQVTPEDIYLPDVISPDLLDMGYCSGTCQYPLHDYYFNFSMHSFLLDRFRLFNVFDVPSDMPESKCAPISYKPLQILELTSSDIFKSEVYQDMSVDICGCR